jgi:glycosyltransferase involved in cell wall biosynthesis
LNTERELIVIDDGSLDKTKDILNKLQKKYNFVFLAHKKNKGKGSAIRTGFSRVTGEIVIIQDADLEYNPQDYKYLLAPFFEKNAMVVYGSRILKNNKKGHWFFYFGGKLMTILANFLYGLKITDEPTGYKVFKKSLLERLDLKSEGFEFCSEVTAKIAKLGIKIYEVPISYYPRGKSEGKKIRLKDGIIGAWTLLKYKFK